MLELLAPLHRGVLAFTGMTVLPPFVAYHVPYAGDDGRAAMLRDWQRHLALHETLTPLAMPRLDQHPEVYPRARRPEAC
jgi:NAD(P)H dehydrogenase (quinone)